MKKKNRVLPHGRGKWWINRSVPKPGPDDDLQAIFDRADKVSDIVKERVRVEMMMQFGHGWIPSLRRIMPNLIAADIIGVQPMMSPGPIFNIRNAFDTETF